MDYSGIWMEIARIYAHMYNLTDLIFHSSFLQLPINPTELDKTLDTEHTSRYNHYGPLSLILWMG